MKRFEKWADKEDKEDEDPRPYGSEKWARKRGWRAALEWMKSVLKAEDTYPRGTSGNELIEDLKKIIEQELED